MTQEDLDKLSWNHVLEQEVPAGYKHISVLDYQAGFKKALELVLDKCHVRDGNTLLTCLDIEDILDSL